MSRHFAICGGQLTGKTALCHHIVSELKRLGFNAGYTQEAVRSGYLMFKGQRSKKMHLESLLIQVSQEIVASEHYDPLICDRSAIDYLAFANLRFPHGDRSVFLDTVAATVTQYSKIYSKVYIMRTYGSVDAGDKIRSGENVTPESVSEEVARLCQNFGISWSWVDDRFQYGERHLIVDDLLRHIS